MPGPKFRAFYVNLKKGKNGPEFEVPVLQEVSDEDGRLTEPMFFSLFGYLGDVDLLEVGQEVRIATIPLKAESSDGDLLDVFDACIDFGRACDREGHAGVKVENLFERLFELCFQAGVDYAMRCPKTLRAASSTPVQVAEHES